MVTRVMDKSTENPEQQEHHNGAHRVSRRTIVLVIIGIVLLAAAVGLTYYFMNRNDDKSQAGTPVEQAVQESSEAFDAGDYQQARQDLEGALSETNDTQEQVQLYSQLSAAAASDGDVQGALDYLAQKHQLAPETEKEDAYIMAQYYEQLDDKAKALQQYEIALNYLQSLPNSDQLDISMRIDSAKARIAELKGQ